MKRFSALALVLLLASAAANAQPPDSQPPKQLRIPGLIEKEEAGAFLIIGRIFPVGWSPEGLFAYVYEAPDEACGCYFFELIVQDLESDKVVWRFDYESEEVGGYHDLAAIWRGKGKEFAAKLHELGVVRRDDVKLELFAASTAKLRADVQAKEVGGDEEVWRHIERYALQLSGPQGQKIIHRDQHPGPYIGPLEVKSQGYLRSPYEARIAVLLEETWRGWEGPPAVVRLLFAGADLESGFH